MHAALLLNDESARPSQQVHEVLAGRRALQLAIP
jgi:hypothetical protein